MKEDIIPSVDNREPPDTLERVRKIFPNAIQEQLKVCDIVYKNVGIELKSINDFVQSIMDGRFRKQLYNLLMNEQLDSYYIIYGSWNEIRAFSNIKMTAVLGAMASITARYAVKVIVMPNKDYAIYVACKIIEKAYNGKDVRPVTHKISTEDCAVNMILDGAERFQEKAAMAALEHFGTVKKIVNSTPKSLESIKGIGKETAKRFFETVNHDFKQKKIFLEDLDIGFNIEEDKIIENKPIQKNPVEEKKVKIIKEYKDTHSKRNELVFKAVNLYTKSKKTPISLAQLKKGLSTLSESEIKSALRDLQMESRVCESDHQKYEVY